MKLNWLSVIKGIFVMMGAVTTLASFIAVVRQVADWWTTDPTVSPEMLLSLSKPFLVLLVGMMFIVCAERTARYIRKVWGLDGRKFLKQYNELGYMVHISPINDVWVEDDPYCWPCKNKFKAPNKGAKYDPLHYSCGRCKRSGEMHQGEVNIQREHVKSLVERELRSWTRVFGAAYRGAKAIVVLTVIAVISVSLVAQAWILISEVI